MGEAPLHRGRGAAPSSACALPSPDPGLKQWHPTGFTGALGSGRPRGEALPRGTSTGSRKGQEIPGARS